MALVLRHGARDFHQGHALSAIAEKGVDDHHIFPRAYLNPTDSGPQYDGQLVDCILNRTLIDSRTNQRIGKRPPHKYFQDVRQELEKLGSEDGTFTRVLASHFLPAEADSPLWSDDFERFLVWRTRRLAAEISAVTRVDVAKEVDAS